MYWVDVYTRVFQARVKRGLFDEYYYVDLFAGSGTCLVKETRDIVLGSAILAHIFAYEQFTKYFFIEKDHRKAASLRRKITKLGLREHDDFEILVGDCNTKIDKIITYIRNKRREGKRVHFLAFIDPEGTEITWKTMEKILKIPSDIIFVLQAKIIYDKLVRFNHRNALLRFYGSDVMDKLKSYDDVLNVYVGRIREVRSKISQYREALYIDPIRIKGNDFFYDVILITREGEYTKAWRELKKKLQGVTGKNIEYLIKALKGEIKSLEYFDPNKILPYLYEEES